jgi:hypothetical protein
VARPTPVSSAIWDIVTESGPCSVAKAAVVSRMASRTSRRCASMVLSHSFGMPIAYMTTGIMQNDLTKDKVYDKVPVMVTEYSQAMFPDSIEAMPWQP